MQSKIVTVLSFVAAVSAHGKVMSPTPRPAGDAFKEACGNTMWNTEQSDPFGNIQGLAQQAGSSLDASKCQLELCKGYKFADNSANVQSYTPGQTVDFQVEIRAPHTGVANVSVVDTTTNSIIGSPLISFENYASTKTGVAANNTAFSVTLPDSLPSNCGTAGNCVLQWWWDSAEAGQTYMSCVDFTSGGSGSGSGATPAVPATPTPATPTTMQTVTATPSAPAAADNEASDPVASAPAASASAPASSCNKRRRALRKRF
ncbi:chitin binding protein [Colletotrichum musicola]|uniref:Chitin binding protein n=1 Tax=Colletotrichum musicola TaxID=2175873 RepID=A0A8H6KK28_9PEZI|nr:chitin binding protein [Colletotrichum musicola]